MNIEGREYLLFSLRLDRAEFPQARLGIVRRHGGRIDLDTRPGEGCRFTLVFPTVPPETDDEEVSQ